MKDMFIMADDRRMTLLNKIFSGLIAVCFVGIAAYMTMTFVAIFITHAISGDFHHWDFFGMWSWARFEIEQPAALIYDHTAQKAFLLSLDPTFPAPMLFPYPPYYLLLIRPLGWLSYPVALVVWSATTLLAYMVAVCAPAWRIRLVLPALFAPAISINLIYGQNGFLTAALLIGGIRLAPSWPVAGGILLGLLAYKPQFGLLIVVALVAARMWRAAIVAAVTVVTAVVASLFAFGLEPWMAWVRAMPDFLAFLDANRERLLPLMPTALANALMLGASDRLAEAIQLVVTAAAAAAVWLAFKPAPLPCYPSPLSPTFGAGMGGGTAGRTAVLATAAILAAPYAFIYDTTLVAAAVAIVVAEYATTLSVLEVLVLGVAASLPAFMLLYTLPLLAAAVHGLLLALILLRCRDAAFPASGRGVDRFVPAGG